MRFVSIASGSSGNCIYVGSENSHILIDAGISARRIEQGLNEIGLKGSDLDGIFVTHEHSDHIRGLGVLARKFEKPIYGTRETLEEIERATSLGKFDTSLLTPVLPDTEMDVGDLTIRQIRWPIGLSRAESLWQWLRIWGTTTSILLIICRI